MPEPLWKPLMYAQETSLDGLSPTHYTKHWAQRNHQNKSRSSNKEPAVTICNKERVVKAKRGYIAREFHALKNTESTRAIDNSVFTKNITLFASGDWTTSTTSAHVLSAGLVYSKDELVANAWVDTSRQNSLFIFDYDVKPAKDEFSWLEELYAINQDSTAPEDLELLYLKIGGYFRNKRFGACNSVLRKIDYGRAPTLILVGLIRRTYPARAMLSEWQDAKQKISDQLTQRGRDAESMLRGLE